MSDLQQSFTVEVEQIGKVDVKMVGENAPFLSDSFDEGLASIDDHSVSCDSGFDSETGYGVRRVTVQSWKDDPEVKGRRVTDKLLTAQFNSMDAEQGVVSSRSPDSKIVMAIARQLIQRLN